MPFGRMLRCNECFSNVFDDFNYEIGTLKKLRNGKRSGERGRINNVVPTTQFLTYAETNNPSASLHIP